MLQLYVPADAFMMGSADNDSTANSDEKPQHSVFLDAFWIDRTEVTNAEYARCVASGQCTSPKNTSSSTSSGYYGNKQFADYPVIYIDWEQAQAYCTWAGRRLPSEAEWEKAARGSDGRIYPWGSTIPTKMLLNFNSIVNETTAVGSYPSGASPYGALDMAGNVWEWVSDWYSNSYYQQSPARNPSGPSTGTYHVLRGGSFYNLGKFVRSAGRYWGPSDYLYNGIGFRCAAGTSP
jgi:formylglycine-generating enzyme required for sulfatase activity